MEFFLWLFLNFVSNLTIKDLFLYFSRTEISVNLISCIDTVLYYVCPSADNGNLVLAPR